MKVALFHNLPPGGARRAAYELVRGSSTDISYDFFGFDLGGADRFTNDPQRAAQDVASECAAAVVVPVTGSMHRRGVPVELARAVDVVNVDRAGRELAAAIDGGGYDLVLADHCQLLQAPSILGRTTTPVVYFVQEPRRQTFEFALSRRGAMRRRGFRGVAGPLERGFDRWIAERDISRTRSAEALVVNSRHSLEFAYRSYGRYAYVSHLGVDDEVFTPRQTSKREGVLSVGSLHAMKGHGHIIHELGRMRSSDRPPLTLVYERGTEAERQSLEELAVELGVELSFEQGVRDSRLAELYRDSAAVLCAASVEPFGLTTIEALACGTPVVAVAEGGYREVVDDHRNGLLVDRRPGAMAAAIECVVRGHVTFDPALLRESVLPYYSWRSAAQRLDDVLLRVASGERMPR